MTHEWTLTQFWEFCSRTPSIGNINTFILLRYICGMFQFVLTLKVGNWITYAPRDIVFANHKINKTISFLTKMQSNKVLRFTFNLLFQWVRISYSHKKKRKTKNIISKMHFLISKLCLRIHVAVKVFFLCTMMSADLKFSFGNIDSLYKEKLWNVRATTKKKSKLNQVQ